MKTNWKEVFETIKTSEFVKENRHILFAGVPTEEKEKALAYAKSFVGGNR